MSRFLHIYPETNSDGVWRYAGDLQLNIDYDPAAEPREPECAPRSLYEGSNPVLMALLSGIPERRVSGFAGPMFPQRGLPTDLSVELRDWAHVFRPGDGQSWLGLRELLQFDWAARTEVRIAVPAADVALFADETSHVEPARSLRTAAPMPAVQIVTWHPTFAQVAGNEFLTGVVGRLKEQLGETDAARVVYWIR